VLAGTRSFGAAVLQDAVAAGRDVAAVFAPVDDKTAEAARARGLYAGPELSERAVRSLGADVILSAHSHAFVSSRVLAATRLGGVGYHPSLLPRHRGRSAVRWTVHMRDPVAGGTVYWLTPNVDAGPIAVQDWCWVRSNWTHQDLWREQLFPMGLRLIRSVLDDLDRGEVVMIPQDEHAATWEPSWEREPLHRPELLALGPMPGGYSVRRSVAG
jgi:methionyl-tRNA formyltransferase